MDYLPVHLATHLTVPNIGLYNRLAGDTWWRHYRRLREDRQAHLLTEVLNSVGFTEAVTTSIRSVPRRAFVPAEYKPVAYLNWSVPLGRNTGLSTPGLVAHYLEQAHAHLQPSHTRFCEIGLGSGYHAAVVSAFRPSAHIIGYEAIEALADAARSRLRSLAPNVEVNAAATDLSDLVKSTKFDYIYQTTASRQDERRQLCSGLVNGGVATTVRPLSADEFRREPRDGHLTSKFDDYQEYRLYGWNVSCTVETIARIDDEPRDVSKLYGVRFVPWRASLVAAVASGSDPDLASLV